MSILTMNKADISTLEIHAYNNWLILKVNKTPKLKYLGNGILLSDFNSNDVKISPEALEILIKNIRSNLEIKNPALEILSKDRIWWPSQMGIIIPPNEILHIYDIPHHIKCQNVIDEELKKVINNN